MLAQQQLAKVEVRYAQLEISIPASCSYGPPAATNYVEVHRKYLKQQAGIFIDNLPASKHTFWLALQPRYQDSYTLNPARLGMVYFSTNMGALSINHLIQTVNSDTTWKVANPYLVMVSAAERSRSILAGHG